MDIPSSFLGTFSAPPSLGHGRYRFPHGLDSSDSLATRSVFSAMPVRWHRREDQMSQMHIIIISLSYNKLASPPRISKYHLTPAFFHLLLSLQATYAGVHDLHPCHWTLSKYISRPSPFRTPPLSFTRAATTTQITLTLLPLLLLPVFKKCP